MTVRDDISIDFYSSPRIITVHAPSTELTIQDLIDTCRYHEDLPINMDDDHLIDASGKENLGGGVSVGITVLLKNAVVAFEARTTSSSDGTATSSSSGKVLTDSAATFIADGVEPGDIIVNFDDESMGTVLTVDSETQITHYQLANGQGNNWQVGDVYKIYNVVQCDITGGNLVAIDENDIDMTPLFSTVNVQIIKTSSSSATLQEMDAIQYSSYQNAVWLDEGSSNTGTAYPVGTREYPVNNLFNAVQIAKAKGFSTLQILSSMTLDSGTNIIGYEIVGKSHVLTNIVMDTTAQCENVTIRNCRISGVLDGGTHIKECVVDSLTYVNGHIHNSGCTGNIVLAGNEDAAIIKCSQIDPNLIPTIDMNISGQNVIITDWSGTIKIANLSGANDVYIQLDGGKVILDSSITGGNIEIHGVGLLEDNATSYNSLSTDGLISKKTITQVNWETVWVDSINGSSGTGWPLGTRQNPSDNMADAKSIADVNGLRNFHVTGSVTLNEAFAGYSFDSYSSNLCTINFNGQNVAGSSFRDINLTGNATGFFDARNCEILSGMTNIYCHLENCILAGTFVVASGVTCNTQYCTTSNSVFNMNGDGSINLANLSGVVTIANSTNAGNILSITGNFVANLLNSCIAGQALISGIGILNDSSVGMTVTARILPASTWDVTLAEHLSAGSTGEKLEEGGTGDPGAIADAVWDENLNEHLSAGTFGGDFQDWLARILGLSHENVFMDNTSYDGSSQLISARVRLFDSKANCDLATNGGSETQGLIATYTLNTVYSGLNQAATIKQVRDS